MIPKRLTIEGLYSYQQKQSIEFDNLTDSHLFGIFGTVGSGKSSILEAITFALYGKTDRLNLSGDNRNYNMMNLKSNLLYIEFDFWLGKEDTEYRVVVQAKRNSKKYEDVKKPERVIYKKKHDEYEPISAERLENLIGLSYDNFKRTIIIPQGKFQEFLQLGNKDRTQMMKELFNLDRFELSFKVKALEGKNNALLQTLNGRLEQLGEISEVQSKDLQHQLNEVLKTIQIITQDQKEKENTLKTFTRLQEISIQLQENLSLQKQLEEQKEKIVILEKELHEFEYCAIHFKSYIDALYHHENKIKQLEKEINNSQKELNDLKVNFKQCEKEYLVLKSKQEQLPDINQEIDDIKKLIEIRKAREGVEKNSIRLQNGTRHVNDLSEHVIDLEKKEVALNNDLKQLRNQLPNIEELTQAQQWHSTLKTLVENHKESLLNARKTEEQSDSFFQKLKNQLNTHEVLSILSENKQNWSAELTTIRDEKYKELEAFNKRIEKTLIHTGLESYANNLVDGEPCLLCGSKEHPSPLNSKDLKSELEQQRKQKQIFEQQIKQLDMSLQAIENYFNVTGPLQSQKSEADAKIKQISEAIEQHQGKMVEKYKDEKSLNETIANTKVTSKSITEKEEALFRLKEEYNKALKNKERFQLELQNIQKETDKQENTIQLLQSQIKEKSLRKHQGSTTDELINYQSELERRTIQIQHDYSHIQEKAEQLSKSINLLEGTHKANQKYLSDEQTSHQKLVAELDVKIENSDFDGIEKIKTVLKKLLDTVAVKQQINDFKHKEQLVNKTIENLNQQLNKQQYNAEAHKKAQLSYEENNQKLTSLIRSQGELQSVYDDLQKKLILKKELHAKREELQIRGDNISTLKKLFASSGFVNYISSVYLQNLCLAANDRFYKMTRQKMSLELNDDNNFEVRDYLNGGKLRSIKTLSGGQTFQAALSLALALSDNIQNMAQAKQNFFFLDEGFGSLDKESLDVVFSTLKNLRKENRIVGIISHVEELQQEIPTYLKISQHEEKGSLIGESWR